MEQTVNTEYLFKYGDGYLCKIHSDCVVADVKSEVVLLRYNPQTPIESIVRNRRILSLNNKDDALLLLADLPSGTEVIEIKTIHTVSQEISVIAGGK